MKRARTHKLTKSEIAQIKADPRIRELRKTMQQRPLNIVERIMLSQLLAEARKGAL